MKLRHLITIAVFGLSSAYTFATPVYSGDTEASGFTDSQLQTGYTIWNDSTDPSKWSIRWTSKNAAGGSTVDWFGSIVFQDSNLGTYNSYMFETSGIYQDSLAATQDQCCTYADNINWLSHTNDTGGVDGIDFTINSNPELLEFNLGSSLFDNLNVAQSGNGVTGSLIGIGQNLSDPSVFVYNTPGGIIQSFEVAVPEPDSIALLGIGLICLAFARRKKV